MQNQPGTTYNVKSHAYELPESFPVELLGYFKQGDANVTYLHFHNCLEIGYCYEGSGVFFIDDKVIPYHKGDVCIIFKDQLHLAQSMKGHQSRWHFVFIDPEKLLSGVGIKELALIASAGRGAAGFENILTSARNPEIVWLVENITAELIRKDDGYESAVKGLVWVLMCHVGRLVAHAKGQTGEKGSHSIIKIAKALEYITRNYMRPIKINELASLCFLSLTSFRRLFKDCVGISPLEYIIKVRIQMAAALLKSTQDSILQISFRVGYSTLSSFNRHFRKVTGMTPRAWRTSNQ